MLIGLGVEEFCGVAGKSGFSILSQTFSTALQSTNRPQFSLDTTDSLAISRLQQQTEQQP